MFDWLSKRRKGVGPKPQSPGEPPTRGRIDARAPSDEVATSRLVRRDAIEPWQTQYPDTDPAKRRYVVIGLDFGTAFTKVVVADKSDSYPVPLRPETSGIDAYLLPGLLGVGEKGIYRFVEGSSGDGRLGNLKLRLLDDPKEPQARADAAGFLALVLQRARATFMEQQAGIFGTSWLPTGRAPSKGPGGANCRGTRVRRLRGITEW